MRIVKFSILTTFLFFSWTAFTQTGNIRGTIIDDATGEGMFAVTCQLAGTSYGAVTDFDGKFDIAVPAGVYDLQVSFVSYQTITITGLVVESDKVSLLEQIRMKEDVELLEEVVVTAEVIKTTESALLTVKKKSANLIDGISAASFRKIGDSDAASAIKRVTGVSVEGGKYVYVRGLGDRYSKTMLNGVDIPGLDPDKNAIQIDIFPTNLIDNMIVSKTASAELPADFTGGLTNIETKAFPDERIFDVSAAIDFNPSMHFNSDFISYDGSNTDWLGFDSGIRQLPASAEDGDIPLPFTGRQDDVNAFVSQFDPALGATKRVSFMDYSLGVALGDQKKLKNENSLGYIFTLTYRSKRQLFDDRFYGDWQRTDDNATADYELIPAKLRSGAQTETNVLLGGLAGVAYKRELSKYQFTAMHLQNGLSRSGSFFDQVDPTQRARGKSNYNGFTDNLEYMQRGVTNFMLRGEHYFQNKSWDIDWALSPTISNIEDPDIRFTTFTKSEASGLPVFDAGGGGFPARLWRFLDERNLVGSFNAKRNLNIFGEKGNLKFGVYNVFKDRDYEIKRMNLTFTTISGGLTPWSRNPNEVLSPQNVYNGNPDTSERGLYYADPAFRFVNSNQYEASSLTTAFYASTEFSFNRLKSIIGLRAENFTQRHTGRNQIAASAIRDAFDQRQDVGEVIESIKRGEISNSRLLDDEIVLDALDFFPSANLVYSLQENQNLRFSYSRTIARPSFKEISYAEIVDPISDRTFIGALFSFDDWDGNLTETRINNFDIRWELFLPRGQTFSVSGFYKTFDSPIELVQIPVARTSLTYQPRNVGNGQILGFEFEFRKTLDFVTPSLDKLYFNANVTLVDSKIDMSEVEFEFRKAFEKRGQTIESTREMAGQAPFLINAGLQYDDFDRGIDAGLFYNVQGETLVLVGGSGSNPDVFSEPFHSLNFNLNKTLGGRKRASINFSINNILGDVREEFYRAFNATPRLFTRFSPERSFGVGFKYRLF